MSVKAAAMLATIAGVIGAGCPLPGYKKPYIRKCLVCGEQISTDAIDPFCGNDCRMSYRAKNHTEQVKKQKKQKPWKRGR